MLLPCSCHDDIPVSKQAFIHAAMVHQKVCRYDDVIATYEIQQPTYPLEISMKLLHTCLHCSYLYIYLLLVNPEK